MNTNRHTWPLLLGTILYGLAAVIAVLGGFYSIQALHSKTLTNFGGIATTNNTTTHSALIIVAMTLFAASITAAIGAIVRTLASIAQYTYTISTQPTILQQYTATPQKVQQAAIPPLLPFGQHSPPFPR